MPKVVSDLRVRLYFTFQMSQRSCWKYQLLDNWTNVTHKCFWKIWRSNLQSFSKISRIISTSFELRQAIMSVAQNHIQFHANVSKPPMFQVLGKKRKIFTFFFVLSLAGNNTLPKLATLIYTQFVFFMILLLQ